jgi:hypothetical protein
MGGQPVQESSTFLEGSQTDAFKEWAKCWIFKSIFKQVFSLQRDSVIGENFPILAILGIYITAIYAIHAYFGIANKIILTAYSALFGRLAIGFSVLFILGHFPKRSYLRYLTPRYVGGFLVILAVVPLFGSAFSSFKQTIPLMHDFCWDRALMRFDRALHFGHHPWRLLEFLLSHQTVLCIIDRLYMLWFLFLFVFCFHMAWTKRRSLRLCFFVSTLLVWILLGSGLGTILSSAGPCYYSQTVSVSEDPFAPLVSRLNEIHEGNFLYAVNNEYLLWKAKLEGQWWPFGGISAMPSIHLAMAALFALVAFYYNKWLGMFFVGYLIVIQIGSVILAWHYAIDGYAGIILACAIWIVVKRIVCKGSMWRDLI